jgi:drug/metabolite transporter (DMT)-like permease
MRSRPLVPFVLATIGFSGGAVITKLILNRGVEPLMLVTGRYLFAIATLPAILALLGRLTRLPAVAWKRGAVLGVVNMALPTVLMTVALERLTASVAAILIALIPLATVAAAHYLVDGERVRWQVFPGFLLALAGCVLLVAGGADNGENRLLGFALMLAGIASAGVGGALTRRYALLVPADRLVLPQFVVATVLVVATTAALGGIASWGQVDAGSWGMLGLLGTVSTVVPFAALLWLSELVTATRVALVAYLVPPLGVLGSVWLLHDPITSSLLGGGLLILVGVLLAEKAERTRLLTVGPI